MEFFLALSFLANIHLLALQGCKDFKGKVSEIGVCDFRGVCAVKLETGETVTHMKPWMGQEIEYSKCE
jgi:hypothetical protein